MVRSLLKESGVLEVLHDKPVSLDIPWSTRRRISVDILGRCSGQMVVVEYDGVYYHSSDAARERDLLKTLALLELGYVVVRLRENRLPDLEINHPLLIQAAFRYTRDEALASRQLIPVIHRVQSAARRLAA